MHITCENAINSYAWVHLEWLSMHITDENTVIVMHGYLKWFSMHITGENTVNSYAWVHFVIFYAYYW